MWCRCTQPDSISIAADWLIPESWAPHGVRRDHPAKRQVEALRQNWLFVERDLIGGNGEALEFCGDQAVVAGRGGEDFAGEIEASG